MKNNKKSPNLQNFTNIFSKKYNFKKSNKKLNINYNQQSKFGLLLSQSFNNFFTLNNNHHGHEYIFIENNDNINNINNIETMIDNSINESYDNDVIKNDNLLYIYNK